MSLLVTVEHVVRDKANVYQDEYDVWKADHELAQACFDFEDLLASGIQLFHDLVRLDERWRLCVFNNELPHDEEFGEAIEDLFGQVSATTFRIEKTLLPFLKGEFGHIKHEEEFLVCARELRGIVTGLEARSTMTPSLRRLRDQATSEQQNGETAEFV